MRCPTCAHTWIDKYGKDECPKCLQPLGFSARPPRAASASVSRPASTRVNRPSGAGDALARPSANPCGADVRRAPGEVSRYKQPTGSAMESASGQCPCGGPHVWRFGKCSKCGRCEGTEVAAKLLVDGCPHGGRHMFKFARCTKCGALEGSAKPAPVYAHAPAPALVKRGSSIEELVSEIEQIQSMLPTREEVLSTFQSFDTDGSGTLTVDELVSLLTDPKTGRAMNMVQATRFINEHDVNRDGQLDLEEWSAAMGLPTTRRAVTSSRAPTHGTPSRVLAAVHVPSTVRRPAATHAPAGGAAGCRLGGECAFAFGRCTKCSQRENWTRDNPATARVRNAGSFRKPL